MCIIYYTSSFFQAARKLQFKIQVDDVISANPSGWNIRTTF